MAVEGWSEGGYAEGPWAGSAGGASQVANPSETLVLTELVTTSVLGPTLVTSNANGYEITVTLSEQVRINNTLDISSYELVPLHQAGMTSQQLGSPVRVRTATPILNTLQSGVLGSIAMSSSGFSNTLELPGASFTVLNVNEYIRISNLARSENTFLRIINVIDATTVIIDRILYVTEPNNGTLVWTHTSAVVGVVLETTKFTNNKPYGLRLHHLITRENGTPFEGEFAFTSVAAKPRVSSAIFLENGVTVVTYSEEMLADEDLESANEYTVAGPSTVVVKSVRGLNPTQVALHTTGFAVGTYTLTVNATGTPKDLAGNPIDPLFNEAIFTAGTPLNVRSIFTDKGPLTKPPLVLQTGTSATIQTYTSSIFGPSSPFTSDEVVFAGAAFTVDHVGLDIELSGSTVNAGTYKIVSLIGISGTRLRLQAGFRLPDANNGLMTWRLIDPRNGEIADDPSDVVVRVNGVVQAAAAVIGLLGQVVLTSAPLSTDTVAIDYSWIPSPTVEFRRLNSKEFVLNNWATDAGQTPNPTQHNYRYKNVTITPGVFVPDDIAAKLAQPLLRELHYRALERAYTAVLNDPHLLVLNTPSHRIAYPPLSRAIEPVSVSYTADGLPEADLVSPWERKGAGNATIVDAELVVEDNTGGGFPDGNPLFWVRPIDLSFPHVFASTWRMLVNEVPIYDGVFSGVAVGWSNHERVLVVGYLEVAGVKKLGFLRRGYGNDPSVVTAWMGGLNGDNPTGQPFTFDWSVVHSYRLFRTRDGIIKLFVDGDVVQSLQMLEEDLPFLEELDDPFSQVQGVFFGTISRPAHSKSTWDFLRYEVLPTNPQQNAPSIFVSYEGTALPEDEPNPWTPIGYHGNESLLSGHLILDSTSSTTEATSVQAGLIGGDFHGFTRIEPLLLVSSDVVLDFGVQLRTFTHGITPNAVMAAIDDGNRLIQLSFFPSTAQPKFSYPGRSLPEDATPVAWTGLGAATATMVGRTLRLVDTQVGDGRVYFVEDLEPAAALTRVIATTNDYLVEAKFKVNSYTPEGGAGGFCGATVDVFDGTRAIGVMLRQVAGVRYLAFHSDGVLFGGPTQFAFEWNDGLPHVLRLTKSTGGDLVSLFVDNSLVGTLAYSSFSAGAGNATLSFGSSTGATSASISSIDWHYVNAWRGQPGIVPMYVGLWKGTDPTTLMGYHLPLKASGKAAVAGNAFTDLSASFITAGVVVGDVLVFDVGSNKGVYEVASVGATTLTITTTFPVGPTEATYRIPRTVDWTAMHKYRIVRDPGGSVAVFLDGESAPMIRVDYSETLLPSSGVGFPFLINRGLPSVTWGAFDPTSLSQTGWDFLRYGVTRAPTEMRIVPHHQLLNQRNVMASPEHLTTNVPHGHTQFSSSSTGSPYPWHDFVNDPAVVAFTQLNENTPLVPSTQTYEVRRPTPVFKFVSGLNNPEDVLNTDGDFLLNDASTIVTLIVPDDVLYNGLEVVEQTTGERELLAPFSDESGLIAITNLSWQNEVCLVYEADTLPENDATASTPWVLESDIPGQVSTTIFGGTLTYAVGATPTGTIYRNPTPLTDPVGLDTTVEFRIKLLNDFTAGTGDTGVRFGFSAYGFTVALAFVSTSMGDREVQLVDLNSNTQLGGIPFDFLDGAFHTYRLLKNIATGSIDFSIDP